jgi:hypothetical protein
LNVHVPHLKSLSGLRMLMNHVSNWYLVLAVYCNLISRVKAKFKDGMEVDVSKSDYSLFYEELYIRHLLQHGYIYNLRTKGKKIIQTPGGLLILIKEFPYSFAIDEIFLMKVYGENHMDGRVIIDIGASIGDTALYFSSLGASQIYCYEPNKDRYEVAIQNIELNKLTDVIHIFNERATGTSIGNLISNYSLKNVFLKIDCDGCEYELFEKTDQQIFENINDIVMEHHGQPYPLISRLSTLGFRAKRSKEIIFATKK